MDLWKSARRSGATKYPIPSRMVWTIRRRFSPHTRKCRELLAGRHHAQAAIVLARAASLEPGRGSILEPLGRAYFMTGQLDRAVETFEALLAVDPTSHYGHYALGRALIRLGRPDEGRTHLRLAVALAPQSALYRGGLRRLGGAGE